MSSLMQRIKLLYKGIASLLLIAGLSISFLAASSQALASGSFYQQTNLVSNIAGKAKVTDANLVNPWGIVAGPKTPFWISDNGTGVSTLYNGNGQPQFPPKPLVVTIPAPKGGSTAAPTGIVFNNTSDFVVSENGRSAASLFIFATEDGTISGWNPTVDRGNAILKVDNSASKAVYKGLAWGKNDGKNYLFATNFRAGVVDVYDANFRWKRSFTDKNLPAGYAPFGISNINGKLFVTFAIQDTDKHDDVAGDGNGFVDVFNTEGTLVSRLVAHGTLDSPWGLALAPSHFGKFSNALLVGNFGDGRINAFNASSGKFLGTLSDQKGNPIVNDGLWGLSFGNGNAAGEADHLFFTAGLNGEQDGLFGVITSED